MSSPGVTCAKCGGRIDAFAFESKRKVAAKLYPGQPVPPPRICSGCLWTSMMKLANDDPEPES